MNDRFKFRCYNKFQEKMFYVKSMSYINGIVQRIEVQDDDRILIFDEWQNNIDNTVLMQSTGLKDKNGKLIYEGDIVKTEAQAGIVINYGIVGFNEKEARFLMTANLKSQDYIYSFWYRDSLEVIGNVYKNKDLLNV